MRPQKTKDGYAIDTGNGMAYAVKTGKTWTLSFNGHVVGLGKKATFPKIHRELLKLV